MCAGRDLDEVDIVLRWYSVGLLLWKMTLLEVERDEEGDCVGVLSRLWKENRNSAVDGGTETVYAPRRWMMSRKCSFVSFVCYKYLVLSHFRRATPLTFSTRLLHRRLSALLHLSFHDVRCPLRSVIHPGCGEGEGLSGRREAVPV